MLIKVKGRWIRVRPLYDKEPEPEPGGDDKKGGSGGGAPAANPPAPTDYGDFDPVKFEKSIASRKGFSEYIKEKYVDPAVKAAMEDDNSPTAKELREHREWREKVEAERAEEQIEAARVKLVKLGLTEEQAAKVKGKTAEDVLENGTLLAEEIAANKKEADAAAAKAGTGQRLPFERKSADTSAIPSDPKEREKYFKEEHRARFGKPA